MAFHYRYSAKVRSYVENDLHTYIEKKKQAFEIMKRDEGAFLALEKDQFFNWIFPSFNSTLAASIGKYTTKLVEEEESAGNVLVKRKSELDQMLKRFNDDIERVRLLCGSNQDLKTDFFEGKTSEEIRQRFASYLTTCRDEGTIVISKYSDSSIIVSAIENAIAAFNKAIANDKLTSNKLKMYKVIIHQVDNYFKLMEYYHKVLKEMDHNYRGLVQSKSQLMVYYDAYK